MQETGAVSKLDKKLQIKQKNSLHFHNVFYYCRVILVKLFVKIDLFCSGKQNNPYKP